MVAFHTHDSRGAKYATRYHSSGCPPGPGSFGKLQPRLPLCMFGNLAWKGV